MVKKWFKKSFSPVSQKPTGSFHYQTFFHNLNRASNNFLCRDHSHLAVPKKICLNLILHQDKQKSKCQCRKFFHFKIFNSTKIPNDEPITTVFMAEIAALKTKEIRIGLLAQILA